MSEVDAILEEAMDNLRESVQRLRATQNRLRSTGLDESPNYRNLSHRVRAALAMAEAAFIEARRRAEREGKRQGRTYCISIQPRYKVYELLCVTNTWYCALIRPGTV